MSWLEQQWCAFDLETTGVDVFTDRIVSWAVGLVGGGQPTLMRTGLVNPGIPIPDGASAIHGIHDHDVLDQPLTVEAADRIAVALTQAMSNGLPVVGWNVVYDLSLLNAELDRWGLPTLEERLGRPVGPVLDGLVLDKFSDKYRKGSRKLVDVARHHGIELSDQDAHGAEADALAAARTIWKIATRSEYLASLTLDELHQLQITWAAEQAESFRAYLIKQGKPADDVTGVWPLRMQVAA